MSCRTNFLRNIQSAQAALQLKLQCLGKPEVLHFADVLQDKIFSEAYSGQRLPFSPVKFLDTWWRSAGGSLAGYQQQDAHEFYLSLLDGLTQHMDRSTTPSASGSPSAAPRAKSLTPTSAGVQASGAAYLCSC